MIQRTSPDDILETYNRIAHDFAAQRSRSLVEKSSLDRMLGIAPRNVSPRRLLDLGTPFDAILAWDSFFHLSPDDQRAMFAVFARHAAPGAALMFTSGPKAGESWGTTAGETVYRASLDPAEYDMLLITHGFKVLHYRPEDPDCDFHTTWLARFTG